MNAKRLGRIESEINRVLSDAIYNGIKDTENKIYESYPCSEAEEALRKLNLNFDHYEKLD